MSKRQSRPAPSAMGKDLEKKQPKIRQGRGLGLKFAIPVSVIITLLLLALGYSLYASSKDALESQINSAGVFSATTLAAPDWHNEDNVARLQHLLTDNVEEVAVYEKNEAGDYDFVISATNRNELKVREQEKLANIGAVAVRRGQIANTKGKEVPFRSFRHPIIKPTQKNQTIAAVEVFISEESMRAELSSLLNSIIVFSIIGILLGIGVSFGVAKSVTKPLHTLLHDIEIISRGDFDHRTRVHSNDEIGVLAQSIDDMTLGLKEAQGLKEDLSSKEHQEQITHEIQEKLFPSTLPQIPNSQVDAVFEAGSELSSDLFDFVELPGDKTGLLLLSASGRGVPAAVILAMARSTFRAVAQNAHSPAATLRTMNTLFSPDLRRGMYVTAVYAVYDHNSHLIKIACAGHKMPTLRWVAKEEVLMNHHPGGIAMGLDKGPVFDRSLEEEEFILEKGDLAVLSSAGLTKLELKSGEELGETRFFKATRSVAMSNESAVATKLAAKIDANLAEDPGEHDMTIISLRHV
ncbi:MAG: serine phosphatase RsbU (regulator of sigma subunit) [Planctomycetota bacterium]|jgi:serine phosphatase RsbU (regulator of sigma subunit)